jgi:hypothetical protein
MVSYEFGTIAPFESIDTCTDVHEFPMARGKYDIVPLPGPEGFELFFVQDMIETNITQTDIIVSKRICDK